MGKATVLIVADQPQLSQALRVHLNSKGYGVHCVLDGLGGLAHAQRVKPNVIVLDLNLPGIDDASVYEQVRKRPDTRAIGIIFISGDSPEQIIETFSRAGINDLTRAEFLFKPFKFEKLEKLVDKLAGPLSPT